MTNRGKAVLAVVLALAATPVAVPVIHALSPSSPECPAGTAYENSGLMEDCAAGSQNRTVCVISATGLTRQDRPPETVWCP